MAWIEHLHADGDALTAAVADQLHACIDAGLRQRGNACLALAGGGTPWPAYQRLAVMPLPWDAVTLLPGDERCVPHEDAACNVTRLREVFAATQARVASLTTTDGDADASQLHAQILLAQMPQDFDAVLLGMGGDGHTASLFPGAPQLREALAPACGFDALRIDPDPLPAEAPYPRITLTLQRLLRARQLLLLISGETKLAVLRAAQADAMRYPIGAVLHAPATTVHIHWSP